MQLHYNIGIIQCIINCSLRIGAVIPSTQHHISFIMFPVLRLGIIGSNNQDVSDTHLQMIELLAYALVLSGNHIYTSGGGYGTNQAVIKGALRACNPDLLTVTLQLPEC